MNTVDAIRYSVIIPSFNAAGSIEACLNSIFKQTFSSFEVWIIDGFSSDSTLQIVRRFKEKYPNVNIISERDRGIYDAMNKGIDRARGEWLLFLGADDELYDDRVLENVTAAGQTANASVMYGNARIIGNTSWAPDGAVYDGVFDVNKLLNKNICHQAIFYRTEFIREQVGYYNIDYRLCADWDFNLRCRAKISFHYMDIIVARFHAGGESTRTQTDNKFTQEFLQNVLSYFRVSPFSKLVNNPSFIEYYKVCQLQKERNYLRYLMNKVQKKLVRK